MGYEVISLIHPLFFHAFLTGQFPASGAPGTMKVDEGTPPRELKRAASNFQKSVAVEGYSGYG